MQGMKLWWYSKSSALLKRVSTLEVEILAAKVIIADQRHKPKNCVPPKQTKKIIVQDRRKGIYRQYNHPRFFAFAC